VVNQPNYIIQIVISIYHSQENTGGDDVKHKPNKRKAAIHRMRDTKSGVDRRINEMQ